MRPVILHEVRNTWLTSAWVLVLTLMLAGCGRMMFAWQGPDPVFAELDIDRDEVVSREEWERAHGTSALDEPVLQFDRGDCNRNGRLTWEEYFALRFKEQHCQASPLQFMSAQPGSSKPIEADMTSIHNAKELHLARLSLVRSRQKLVKGKYHEDYSERDMTPGTLYRYTLSCGDPGQIEIPEVSQDFREISRLGFLEPGFHSAIRCTVSNQGTDTVTYLRLRLTHESAEGEATTFHGKTLWIPPQDSRDLWVLPGSADPIVAIELLAVRLKAG
jgi:hypothetical protein